MAQYHNDLDKIFIGFDPANLFNNRGPFTSLSNSTKLKSPPQVNAYPPYNVLAYGDTTFVIEMAVAGFSRDELSVSQEDRQLIISGKKADENVRKDETVVHRGISTKKFTRQFKMVEYLEVREVKLDDGILTIRMELEIPEEKKPVEFKIK